jgi:hypothetical protein
MSVGLVTGDPHGWQDIGYALGTLLGQLQNELEAADAAGGSGLAGSWSGPAASAYQEDWGRRRSRYADLLWNAQQAASAIYNYGQRLADIVVQAGRLEATWLGVGLELSDDGFRLPRDVESLPHLWQQSLRAALTESERDAARIQADVTAAYEDLWTAVRDALKVLEDFQFIELSGIMRLGRAYLKEDLLTVNGAGGVAIGVLSYEIVDLMKQDLAETKSLATEMSEWLRDGTPGERSVAGKWLPRLGRDAEHIDADTTKADRGLGAVGYVVGAIPIAASLISDVRKDGVTRGLETGVEQNAGNIASLALTGVEMTAGAYIATAVAAAVVVTAPADLVAVGGIVIGGAIAFGVGEGVQAVVNHRQAIGHAIDEAATWEDKHVLGWL